MIRQPSSFRQMFAWHNAAINGDKPPQFDGLPECGYFKRKMVKGGPWVPARIYLERDIDPSTFELTAPERFCLEVEGIKRDDVEDQWTYLTPISKAEFDHLSTYALSDSRMMDTMNPMDLSDAPTSPQGIF